MNKPMYKRYENKKPVGTMHYTNCFGVAFFEPEEIDKYDCDYIVAWYDVNNGYRGFRKHTVFYTASGRAYINKGRSRVYLDEVMRVA